MNTECVTTDPPRSLSEWRDREEITTDQAAKRLRISQSYYCKLEKRKQRASGKTAKRIHQKTQVPVSVLVGAA